MRHLYLLAALLALPLLALARRPGRHAPGATRPSRPRRRVRPYLPVEPPPPPELYARHRLVGPWLIAHERQQEQARADRTRLGLAVLMDIAEPADPPDPGDDMAELADVIRAYLGTTGAPVAMWHCPAPRCEMSAVRPVAHECPLIDPARAQQRPMAEVTR